MNDSDRAHGTMRIGEFSRRSRLSYKALRLYDAMGLRPPAFVDDASGYRYYTEAQLERDGLIGLLRRLEVPLEEIARILELDRAQASRAVQAHLRQVESGVHAKRQLVRYLRARLEGRENAMFAIHTRSVPEQKVVSVQGHVTAPELPDFIGTTMHRLLSALTDAGLAPSAAPFVVYHGQVDVDSDGPVETCVPFEGTLEPSGDLRIRLEPAHEEAYTRLTKGQVAFPGILEAYDAVGHYVRTEGLAESDPPREVYFADWSAVGDDEAACDIAFPLERRGGA